MRPQISSNACSFDADQCEIVDNRLADCIEPYESLVVRFCCALRKGDSLLVHLMLKQAMQGKSKKVMSDMLNALVHFAVKLNN